MTDLPPCPLCGGGARLARDGERFGPQLHVVKHTGPGRCYVSTPRRETAAEAEADWRRLTG